MSPLPRRDAKTQGHKDAKTQRAHLLCPVLPKAEIPDLAAAERPFQSQVSLQLQNRILTRRFVGLSFVMAQPA